MKYQKNNILNNVTFDGMLKKIAHKKYKVKM